MLEHHTDLGAGYRIALKDLELRGAGNLLGAEQSGHAQAVGFDLYMRWLEETVKSLRGQGTTEQPAPPDVVLDRPAHLPDGYVPDDDAKLDLYRRLARATSSGDIDGLRDELRERFGPLPVEAETLLDMARLRVLGAALGLQHVLVRGDEARLTYPRRNQPAARRAHFGTGRRAARRRSAADAAALAPSGTARRRADRARAGAGAQGGGEVTFSGDVMRRNVILAAILAARPRRLRQLPRPVLGARRRGGGGRGPAALGAAAGADHELGRQGRPDQPRDRQLHRQRLGGLCPAGAGRGAGQAAGRFGQRRRGGVAGDLRAQGHALARHADGPAGRRLRRRDRQPVQGARPARAPAHPVRCPHHRARRPEGRRPDQGRSHARPDSKGRRFDKLAARALRRPRQQGGQRLPAAQPQGPVRRRRSTARGGRSGRGR